MNYVLIMPVLNEIEHLSDVINSVLNQSLKPILFIIIDGGSTDGTWELLEGYQKKYPWVLTIKQTNYKGKIGHKKISCAMVEAYEVMESVTYKSITAVGHIDGDFMLEQKAFENMNKMLDADPKVGVVGGILYTEGNPEVYPKDELPNIRLYRRAALEQIGGYPYSKYSWDSVILAKLRMAGWTVKPCEDAKVINLRSGELTAQNRWQTAVSFGEARHYLGYSLLLFLAGTVYATRNNGIVFGIGLIKGYFGSIGKPTTKDRQIYNYYQNERLNEVLGK